ncbi:MAG: hypothetical protein PHX21_08070 [bacterium]|nr:hypothetical protein [bacterium]
MNFQKFDVVYFSIDKWGSLQKRPHHFVKELLKTRKVLFVEDASHYRKRAFNVLLGNIAHLSKLDKNLWRVYLDLRLPLKFKCPVKIKHLTLRINHIIMWYLLKKIVKSLNFSDIVTIGNGIYIYPIDEICRFNKINRHKVLGTVYDCVDDHKEFADADYNFAFQIEQNLSEKSNLVFFTAKELIKRPEMKKTTNAFYVPNGVEWEKFNSPNTFKPIELSKLEPDSILFGYIGMIAKFLDFNILSEILEMNKNYMVCLIGDFLFNFERDYLTKKIKELSNKYGNRFIFLGAKPYESIPNYVKNFDICLIPFIIQKRIKSVLPAKVFQYFAAGKGVISTRWEEMEQFSSIISLVSNNKELEIAISREISLLGNEKVKKERVAFAENYDWEKIVENSLQITSDFIKATTK